MSHPLFDLHEKRVENNQDLIVIVDDHHNRRGTGKTVLSIKLAEAFDRTDEGLTKEKVSLTPADLIEAYTEQPRGSALILDEAEAGVSKYRASSSTNLGIRRLVSMGRIMEKYVIFNLPASAELDRDLKALCDVWISVERKGLAQVHFLGWNPYQEHPLTPQKGTIEWADISDPDLQSIYDYLADEKMKHLEGTAEGSTVITSDTHEQQLELAKRETEQETRDQMIRRLYREMDVTQAELAEAVDLSRSRIADIVREDPPSSS